MIVSEAIAKTSRRLADACCDSPRLDAERLVERALNAKRVDLYAEPNRALTPAEIRALGESADRRCRREPLAYILGEWGFRHLVLEVTPAVLVPRPETEIVVERCLDRLADRRAPKALDIGTGSGAIALALASEHVDVHVTATDCSREALAVAERNAQLARLTDRVTLVHGDLFAGQRGPFDLVVSNPPYISPEEYERLAPELEYEPKRALVGTDFHTRIAAGARETLAPHSWLVLESGETEADAVALQLKSLGFGDVCVFDDLTGRPRGVEGRASA